jgi:hypothetical protein
MRRVWPIVPLLFLTACSMFGSSASTTTLGVTSEATTTTSTLESTTIPGPTLDPAAPPQNTLPGAEFTLTTAEGQWLGRSWRFTAGGPVDISYLDSAGCEGWASVEPLVVYSLPSPGRWDFTVVQDVLSDQTVLVVYGPDGDWTCTSDYQANFEGPFGPAVMLPAAQPGSYAVWVATAAEGASIQGSFDIAAPTAP